MDKNGQNEIKEESTPLLLDEEIDEPVHSHSLPFDYWEILSQEIEHVSTLESHAKALSRIIIKERLKYSPAAAGLSLNLAVIGTTLWGLKTFFELPSLKTSQQPNFFGSYHDDFIMGNTTCGSLYPLHGSISWDYADKDDNYFKIADICSGIANKICLSQDAARAYWVDQYNMTLSGTNYSCYEKYISFNVCDKGVIWDSAYSCYNIAMNAWQDLNMWEMMPEWWSTGRIVMLTGSLIGVALFVAGGTMLYATTYRWPKTQFWQLELHTQTNIEKICDDVHIQMNDSSLIKTLDSMQLKQEELQQNKKLITKARLAFLSGCRKNNDGSAVYPQSPLAQLSVDRSGDITKSIFWYAGLWNKKPGSPQKYREENKKDKTWRCGIL